MCFALLAYGARQTATAETNSSKRSLSVKTLCRHTPAQARMAFASSPGRISAPFRRRNRSTPPEHEAKRESVPHRPPSIFGILRAQRPTVSMPRPGARAVASATEATGTPNLSTKIVPTKIRSLETSGTFPMGLGIPPLQIKILLESSPPISRISVRRATGTHGHVRTAGPRGLPGGMTRGDDGGPAPAPPAAGQGQGDDRRPGGGMAGGLCRVATRQQRRGSQFAPSLPVSPSPSLSLPVSPSLSLSLSLSPSLTLSLSVPPSPSLSLENPRSRAASVRRCRGSSPSGASLLTCLSQIAAGSTKHRDEVSEGDLF